MAEQELGVFVIVEQHNLALLFSNYLRSQSISSDVVPTERIRSEMVIPNNQFAILCDLNHLAFARQEFEAFIKNPHHPKYQEAAWNSGEVVPQVISNSDNGFMQHLLTNAGPLTLGIMVVNIAIFLLAYFGFANELFSALKFDTSLSEPWRFITPALFHFSWLHLVFNTMWWWMLGGQVERKLGAKALLNLFMLSAITSNAAQYLVSGPNFGGLSGVVYALLGYTWWSHWLSPEKGLFISKPIVGFMLVWLLIGFVDVLPMNVANTAHLVGLVAGCALAYVNRK